MKIFIIINILFVINSNLSAQLAYSPMSETLLEGANAIIRDEQQTFEVQSVGKGIEKYKMTLTVLNEDGDEYAELQLPYSKLTKLRDLSATLYNAVGKQVRKAKSSDFQDLSLSAVGFSFFDDNRIKIIDLSYVEYPYTIVFEYELLHDGLLFYPNWSPQPEPDIAVEKSVFEVTLPAAMSLRYKALNFTKQPDIKTGDKKTYRWEARNVAAYTTEPYTPAAQSDEIKVLTAPVSFEIEGYTGDMSSWQSFGQFISKLNDGTRKLPEASVAKFKTLVQNCTDDLCKIQKLYDYLQANTRYVSIQLGIGGWRPMPASEVDAAKYGDCKALSNYFCAMLESVGILGYYTLIRAGDDATLLHQDFPSSQFNHVVVCVPQKNDTIWVECTSQNEALGYAGSFTGSRTVLLITPQGGKLIHTPNYTAQDNLQNRVTQLTLLPDGTAEATIRTQYTAVQQEYASYLAEMPEQQRRDKMYENVGLKNFEIIEHRFARQKNRLPSVEEHLKLRLPAYAGKSGKRLFVLPNVLAQWRKVPQADSTRLHAIQFLSFAFLNLDTIQIAIPKGYGVERLPEIVKLNSAFGEYEASCIQKGKELIYCRRLLFNNSIQPKESYNELVEFCKKIQKADGRKVVLVQQEP